MLVINDDVISAISRVNAMWTPLTVDKSTTEGFDVVAARST
jgi:hypothetical protein